jgi:transmembrane sensor
MRLLDDLHAAIATHAGAELPKERSIDVEAALAKLHQRIDARTPATPRALRVPSARPISMAARRTNRWAIGGLAAAAAAVALVFGLRGATSRSADGPGTVASAGRSYATAIGAIESVLLSDGTRVVLAPGSRLSVASSFGQGARDVTLEGIARFTVRHDAAAPFVVHAGGATVRDIGTQFVVRAPSAGDASVVSVAVLEGAVTVASSSAEQNATAVRAGDRAELRADGRVVSEAGAVGGDADAWMRGELVYQNATLDVVRDDLRRWYGIDLRVADATLATRRLTGTFERASVDEVLQRIALALGATVERSGAVATLRAAAIAP